MTSADNGNQPADLGGANPADYSQPGPLNGLRVLEICDEKGQVLWEAAGRPGRRRGQD